MVCDNGKAFIFLYPQPEIFKEELWGCGKDFISRYKTALNRTIDERYRQKGFSINYAILDDCSVSGIIKLQSGDSVLKVGMDSVTHRTPQENGTYPYPNPDFILGQLGDISVLRVGGFHVYSCCEKLAKRAHERGIDSLVDEELTQFFSMDFEKPNFRVDVYPSIDQRQFMGDGKRLKSFLEKRENRPWLWNWSSK